MIQKLLDSITLFEAQCVSSARAPLKLGSSVSSSWGLIVYVLLFFFFEKHWLLVLL